MEHLKNKVICNLLIISHMKNRRLFCNVLSTTVIKNEHYFDSHES
jgi:hypothetical protein